MTTEEKHRLAIELLRIRTAMQRAMRELQDALTKIDTQLATSDKWDKNE
jgi:hypothetical protein